MRDSDFGFFLKDEIPSQIYPPLQICRRSGMSHRKKFLELQTYLNGLPVMTSDKNNCVTKVNLGNIKSESVVERGSHLFIPPQF